MINNWRWLHFLRYCSKAILYHNTEKPSEDIRFEGGGEEKKENKKKSDIHKQPPNQPWVRASAAVNHHITMNAVVAYSSSAATETRDPELIFVRQFVIFRLQIRSSKRAIGGSTVGDLGDPAKGELGVNSTSQSLCSIPWSHGKWEIIWCNHCSVWKG